MARGGARRRRSRRTRACRRPTSCSASSRSSADASTRRSRFTRKELELNPGDTMAWYQLGRHLRAPAEVGRGDCGAAALDLAEPVLQRALHPARARVHEEGPARHRRGACCAARSSTTRTTSRPTTCSASCCSRPGRTRGGAQGARARRAPAGGGRAVSRWCYASRRGAALVAGRRRGAADWRVRARGRGRRGRARRSPRSTAASSASASSSRRTAPASPGSTTTTTAGSTRSCSSGTQLEEGTRRGARVAAGRGAHATVSTATRRDGTFRDVTDEAGLRRTGWASSVCAGDYDNDGWLDLFVTYYGRNVLYRNRGGRFEDVTAAAGLATSGTRWGSGCSFLDYDRDGRLDLFVANYLVLDLETAPEPGQGANCLWKGIPVNCGPKGLPTDTNLLYHNEGDGRFRDVSEASGIARVKGRYPMTAAAADFDGDGWTDIYVACDSTAAILLPQQPRRHLHRRGGGERRRAQRVRQRAGGHGARGRRLRRRRPARPLQDPLRRRHPGALPQPRARACSRTWRWPRASACRTASCSGARDCADLDNDGWPDLLYATGNVYPEIEALMPAVPAPQPEGRLPQPGRRSLRGRLGPQRAGRRAPRTRAGASPSATTTTTATSDVLVMNMNEPPSLLRNDYERRQRLARQVQLEGTRSNRAGIGATVVVTAGGRRQARAVLSQSSYYSHDDLRLHFGLGAARCGRARRGALAERGRGRAAGGSRRPPSNGARGRGARAQGGAGGWSRAARALKPPKRPDETGTSLKPDPHHPLRHHKSNDGVAASCCMFQRINWFQRILLTRVQHELYDPHPKSQASVGRIRFPEVGPAPCGCCELGPSGG